MGLPALIWAPRSTPPPVAIGSVLGLGLLCTALAYLLYFRLLERIGPTRTATVTYLLPVFGLLWGALFLGERITGGMAAGLTLIVVSMLFMSDRVPRVRFGRIGQRLGDGT